MANSYGWRSILKNIQTTNNPDQPEFYGEPEKYLAQGDIFSLDLVLPFADSKKRIFRAPSGRPADRIPYEGKKGLVFSEEELLAVISNLPQAKQVSPFDPIKADGLEMVIADAALSKFFIIASQTCDISGVDHSQRPVCVIAPIMTLASFFLSEATEAKKEDGEAGGRILDYLNQKLRDDPNVCKNTDIQSRDLYEAVLDDFGFPDYIRSVLPVWKPKKNDEQNFRGKLIGFLKEIVKNGKHSTYYLPKRNGRSASTERIPEGYIDYTRLYSVPTAQLEERIDARPATILSPYKEEFAQRMSMYYSRIATPSPIEGESFS